MKDNRCHDPKLTPYYLFIDMVAEAKITICNLYKMGHDSDNFACFQSNKLFK